MSTLEERVAALEAAQAKRGLGVTGARAALLEAATRYANMKTFGISIDAKGYRTFHGDAEKLAKDISEEMETIAMRILREAAIEGTK